MNRRHVAMFLLLAPLAAGGSRAAGESSFDPAAATNAFGVDLYRQLHAEGSNLFFSPASIAGALSMTSIGARGVTADEMDRVLHLSGDDAGVAAAFGDPHDDAHRRERPRDPERGQPPVRAARLRILARVHRPARPTLQGRARRSRLPHQSRRRPQRYQRLGRVADGAQDPRPAGPRRAPCRHPPGAGQRHPLPGHLAAAVRRRCHHRRPVPPRTRRRRDGAVHARDRPLRLCRGRRCADPGPALQGRRPGDGPGPAGRGHFFVFGRSRSRRREVRRLVGRTGARARCRRSAAPPSRDGVRPGRDAGGAGDAECLHRSRRFLRPDDRRRTPEHRQGRAQGISGCG
ncbi:MAG: hypothetical protein IPH48_18165 [bacterium]|nr:hypothetical protein [bacterium]